MRVPCPHWSELEGCYGGACGPGGKFPGQVVSLGSCHRCLGLPPPSPKGLGGMLAAITRRLGIKKCGGCADREKVLDELVPNPHRNDSEGEIDGASGPGRSTTEGR